MEDCEKWRAPSSRARPLKRSLTLTTLHPLGGQRACYAARLEATARAAALETVMIPDTRASRAAAAFRASVFWLLLGAICLLGLMVHRALATVVQDGLIAAIMDMVMVVPLASFCGTSRRGT